MKLLKSNRKIPLPIVYFISDKKEIKDIPIGVPFIFGDESIEKDIIRVLEYEVLFQSAKKTGYPFNFKKILMDAGFLDLKKFYYRNPVYLEYKSEEHDEDIEDYEFTDSSDIKSGSLFSTFVKDAAAYVDIEKLKDLKIFPVWFSEKIENVIHTNIHNFATINPLMYNKKLEGIYGEVELTPPLRGLIIIDISGSIPKAVSTTCLIMAKNLSESFYADLLITGSKSTLYTYENIHTLDVQTIYEENEMGNDQVYFKKLVSSEKRSYKTAIVFGDNHSPSYAWKNKYNINSKEISREDGQKLCQWEVDHLISLHTSSEENIAGYADWFTPKSVEKIKDWVKYLD